jgi:hypothetical protein
VSLHVIIIKFSKFEIGLCPKFPEVHLTVNDFHSFCIVRVVIGRWEKIRHIHREINQYNGAEQRFAYLFVVTVFFVAELFFIFNWLRFRVLVPAIGLNPDKLPNST